MKVSLGLYTYHVSIDPKIPNLGQVVTEEGRDIIQLQRLDDWEDYQTLFHECLHIADINYGIKLGEERIRALEQVVPMLLIQNPWLLEGLINHAGTRGTAQGPTSGAPGQEGADGSEEPGQDGQES